ncbi:OmpA family protein [Pseudomonas caspiana]|uniref:Flagellar motor protein MotB n=1 Tax=Pseudomonas caspiana TaxID=1451454 RepID=A0A1Y3NXI4_9PSED|nr:OmpA family protein [Pseudomonas caspiana]OUM71232.1 flagellar motor protein MotB [Pseudomonas caspiana]
MTALFEMRIRVGGDPRGFHEFIALRTELAKLSHPACPDVDWAKVEQLCLALFEVNGAELQTVAAFILARSQLHGLDGMAEGMALMEAMGREWASVWPTAALARADILTWLFAQLQHLLRRLDTRVGSVQMLGHLESRLAGLYGLLQRQDQVSVTSLSGLRQQISSRMLRLEQDFVVSRPTQRMPTAPEPAFVMPVVILTTPRASDAPISTLKTTTRRTRLWLLGLAATVALGIGLVWKVWLANPDTDLSSRVVNIFYTARVIPDAVRLDSLSLFDAGSSVLKPDSTKILINALVSIKAQPGWLIVIAGHTDSTGDVEQNIQISHARASAVRDWMQRMGGISANCFAVQGFGAREPIATNETDAGRATNRRVDIRLVPQAGACK